MPKKERKSHVWSKHPDNWYVEEPWCAERLFNRIGFAGTIHDPCCGMGTIPRAARKAGYHVTGSDIANRAFATHHTDPGFKIVRYQDDRRIHDNIITNPPFDDVNKCPWPFIRWALTHVHHQVALLVPFKWFSGDKRSRLLETLPLTAIYVLTPRPSMPPGDALLEMRKRGEEPGGGKEDFAWAIFHPSGRKMGSTRPLLGWIHRDGA